MVLQRRLDFYGTWPAVYITTLTSPSNPVPLIMQFSSKFAFVFAALASLHVVSSSPVVSAPCYSLCPTFMLLLYTRQALS